MEKRDSAKKRKTKEKITEIFTIEQPKKESNDENIPEEKTIIQHAEIEKKEEEPSKKDVKKENKIIRNAFIILLGFVILFLIFYGIFYYTNHFEVEGVKFEIDKTTMIGKTLYKTSLSGIINSDGNFKAGIYPAGMGKKAEYNIYLRNDPRILQKRIPFHGGINFKQNMVINMENDFNCNGDGVIAIANLLNVYKALGIIVIRDENATCDDLDGRYLHLDILADDEENYISSWGLKDTCYNLNIKECDILPVTEKFIIETLIEANQRLRD